MRTFHMPFSDTAMELVESFRIASSQIRAHKMRSILTALGVIIGIIAVTLMGSAISGIEIGFERSLAVIGDDILYVEKWPWHNVDDWWNYRNRRRIESQYADTLNRLIAATPNSQLVIAVPTLNTNQSVKYGDNEVKGVFTQGTTDEFPVTSTAQFKEGRFLTAIESRGAQCLHPRLRRGRRAVPEGIGARQDGDDRRQSVPRHRRLQQDGHVPRTVQFRHAGGRADVGVHENVQRAPRYLDPREGEGQESPRRRARRADRRHAPRARITSGAKGRFRNQCAGRSAQHDRAGQGRHRHRR